MAFSLAGWVIWGSGLFFPWQHRNRLWMAGAGAGRGAVPPAPGVTLSRFGCAIAAVDGQGSQWGFSSLIFQRAVEAGGLVGLEQPQQPEQEPSLAAAAREL